jgi:cytochrome oxidase assembly protein ShyY1
MYSFLFKPKWIGFHLLCLAAIVGMINLGLWQLSRLDEKQSFNDRVTAHDAAEPVALTAALLDGAPNDLIYRRVEASGVYVTSPQFEVVNVTQDGTTGRNVVNALRLADGSLVLVNRGFVPTGSPVSAPPAGEVSVLARLKAGQRAGTGQPRDDGSSELTEIRRVDLGALAQQFDQPIAPMYLDLLRSTPPEPATFSPVAFPDLSDGPHLSYTIQWFIFTICVAVGWVFAVRKSVRERSGKAPKKPSTFKAVERYDPSAS